MAELIARAHVPPSWDLGLASAGVEGHVGRPLHASMGRLLDGHGIPAAGFAARQLTDELIRDAGLILTMTLDHRRSVVNEVPSALRRTFTLKEFVLLSTELTASSLSELVDAARQQRGAGLLGTTPDELEISDPFGRSQRTFERCYDEIDRAVRSLLAGLGARPSHVSDPTGKPTA